MSLLEVKRISSGYGDMTVLHGVSVCIDAREIVSIIGPNGAGKSTLMKTVFGLLRPQQGSIFFDGQEITRRAPDQIVRLGMCYVPQVENVFPSLTVEENLEMGGFILRDGLGERKEHVYQLFPLLRERRKQRVGKMSGGERQMVAMGRALMLHPKLLLLDEPSAGLAPKMVDLIFGQVERINQAGVAIVMVEQNARRSLEIADRAYILANGQNRHEGSGQALLHDPDVARLYLGG
jgi:branched-chain amino acid transport system ATP-binding protein/neutral amino acid transport system ATP-binding protein